MKKKKLSLGGLPDIGFMDQDAGSLPGAFGDKAAPRPAAVKLKKELAAKKVASRSKEDVRPRREGARGI